MIRYASALVAMLVIAADAVADPLSLPLAGIKHIEVTGNLQVTIRQAAPGGISDPSGQAEVARDGDTLRISRAPAKGQQRPYHLQMSVAALASVTVSGNAVVNLQQLALKDLALSVVDAAVLNVNNLDTGSLVLAASDHTLVMVSGLQARQLVADVEDAAQLALDRAGVDSLLLRVSGDGNAAMAGHSYHQMVSVENRGQLDASALRGDRVSLSIEQQGQAAIWSRSQLQLDAEPGADVTYRGEPRLLGEPATNLRKFVGGIQRGSPLS